MSDSQPPENSTVRQAEPEFEGPIWKHPYLIYVMLTAALFLVLVIAGWLAWTNDWLPKR